MAVHVHCSLRLPQGQASCSVGWCMSSRSRKSLSAQRLGPRAAVSSASLEAWNGAFQASIGSL